MRYTVAALFLATVIAAGQAAAQSTVESNRHFDKGGGDLALVGDVSYDIIGDNIRIQAESVQYTGAGTSGTLRLQIWATTTPYNGGGITGFILGTATLGQLNQNQEFANIDLTVPLDAPPNGTYSITMTLEEFQNAFVVVDFFTFSGTLRFGPAGCAATPSSSPASHAGELILLLATASLLSLRGRFYNIDA